MSLEAAGSALGRSWERIMQEQQERREKDIQEKRRQLVGYKPPEKVCDICEKQVEFELKPDWEEYAHWTGSLDFFFTESGHDECRIERERRLLESEHQKFIESEISMTRGFGLPKDWRSKTLETFVADSESERAKKVIQAWTPEDKVGILFIGPAGTGKSHLILSALNKVALWNAEKAWKRRISQEFHPLEFRPKHTYMSVSQFFGKLRSDMGWEFEKEIGDFLFFDDLGTENTTEWSREIIFRLLEHCVSENKTVFISTNLTMNELKERLHERIVSRIMQLCVPVQVKGEDRRRKAMLAKAHELRIRAGLSADEQ